MTSWFKDIYKISTDQSELQIDEIYSYLSKSYWATGRPKDIVERSISNSLCFGLYSQGRQIGFARVVTDQATFAYLCDVYILEEFQGDGLGKWLLATIVNYPSLQGLRRWMLVTRDAQRFYGRYGFTELKNAENWMEIFSP